MVFYHQKLATARQLHQSSQLLVLGVNEPLRRIHLTAVEAEGQAFHYPAIPTDHDVGAGWGVSVDVAAFPPDCSARRLALHIGGRRRASFALRASFL